MFKKSFFIFLVTLILFNRLTFAAGLRTAMGHIDIDNLTPGHTYSLANDNNTPFVLKNTGDTDLNVKIEVLKPAENELVDGYAPIPDTGWIEISESEFTIPAEDEISTDVIIKIPYGKEYKGKAYQAYIWSHSTGRGVIFGLKSKLLISIAE